MDTSSPSDGCRYRERLTIARRELNAVFDRVGEKPEQPMLLACREHRFVRFEHQPASVSPADPMARRRPPLLLARRAT